MAGQSNSELFDNLEGRGGELGQGRLRAEPPHSAVRKDRPENVLVFSEMIEGWNKLPVNVRSAASNESFRKRL